METEELQSDKNNKEETREILKGTQNNPQWVFTEKTMWGHRNVPLLGPLCVTPVGSYGGFHQAVHSGHAHRKVM